MIDCYHRIRCLNKTGIGVHLHSYEYGRPHSRELEEICSTVTYYPRDTSFGRHLSVLPYSLVSRNSRELLENLAKDDSPILFDGIQTTIFLAEAILAKRKKAVRLHNTEPRYYRTLAAHERNPVNKAYYLLEAARLQRHERILKNADYLLTISIADHDHYNRRFRNSILIPPSHPFDKIDIQTGTGQYILYHADLSVNENIAVSKLLIRKVFSRIPHPCIIAGKNPPSGLESEIRNHRNIEIVPNPGKNKMDGLIKNAQINIIPTMASNGLKLKLLVSLFCGRHCIANNTAVNASGLYSLCHIADSADDMIGKINMLFNQPFTEEMTEERKKVLSLKYDNMTSALKLAELLFPEERSQKEEQV